jgi:ribosomal protein L14E/L6E/L27E
MALIEVGRVCIKKYGRDAGSKAVITAVQGSTVTIVSESRPRERKCNPSHLEFLNETIDPKNKEQLAKIIGIKEQTQRPAKQTQAKKS